MNEEGLIGINNELPWHIPEDLKRFKQVTMNQTVIMGKNTFLSLLPYFVDKEVLPNRNKIILTSASIATQPNITTVKSIENIKNIVAKEIQDYWLIGGTSLFCQLFDIVDQIYLTKVNISTSVLKEKYLREKNTLFNQIYQQSHLDIYHFLDMNLQEFKIIDEVKGAECDFITYERIKK